MTWHSRHLGALLGAMHWMELTLKHVVLLTHILQMTASESATTSKTQNFLLALPGTVMYSHVQPSSARNRYAHCTGRYSHCDIHSATCISMSFCCCVCPHSAGPSHELTIKFSVENSNLFYSQVTLAALKSVALTNELEVLRTLLRSTTTKYLSTWNLVLINVLTGTCYKRSTITFA